MTTQRTADEWIAALSLLPHPEGGYYKELYRSTGTIAADALPAAFAGARSYVTSIYFLLKSGECSHYHRLRSDELWYFHTGSSLTISVIGPDGALTRHRLGAGAGDALQFTVPAGCWFGAEVDAADSYSLISCAVAPGFDFADFELGNRTELLRRYPDHAASIETLTIDPQT